MTEHHRLTEDANRPELPLAVMNVAVALNGELTRLQTAANTDLAWGRRVRLMELRVEASAALSTLVRAATAGRSELDRATSEALSVLGRVRTEG
jgi:hypothetical protein